MAWDPAPVVCYESSALRILFGYLAYHPATDTYPIDAHLARLEPRDHVFLFLTWHRIGFHPQRLRQYNCFPCQITLCANTPEEHAELQQAGVRSIYFNHNATLDDRIFCITGITEQHRPYRLLVNSAFAPYKRLHLAAQVEDAAFIGYLPGSEYHAVSLPANGRCLNLQGQRSDERAELTASSSCTTGTTATSGSLGSSKSSSSSSSSGGGGGGSGSGGSGGSNSNSNRCCDSSGQQPACESLQLSQLAYLSPQQIAAALNRSMVGGMFSEEEGACWSTTEYLLCGLPVVSTASRGGREVWLHEGNSIIVDPTPEAVEAGVDRAVEMLHTGAFNRQHIRQGAVEQARQFRATLVAEVQRLFDQHCQPGREKPSAERWLQDSFVHKMGL